MKILALDPGVTTGWAVGTIDKTLEITAGQDKFSHIEFWNKINDDYDWIVCESFEYRNRSRAGLVLYSCELIGVLKLYADQSPVALHMQTAATGKGYYTDEKLKSLGVHKKAVPHGMDAVRHLLHWYTFGPGFKFNKGIA